MVGQYAPGMNPRGSMATIGMIGLASQFAGGCLPPRDVAVSASQTGGEGTQDSSSAGTHPADRTSSISATSPDGTAGPTGTTAVSDGPETHGAASDSPACGDRIKNGDEDCDGLDLGGIDCSDLDFFGGELSCDESTCTFDASQCHNCGNGTIGTGEECESSDLGGVTCEDFALFSGQLGCDGSCRHDLAECLSCTDVSPGPGGTCPEVCDNCVGNVCEMVCYGTSACQSSAIVCPPGFNCKIECSGTSACQSANIACPTGRDCEIACTGTSACQSANIGCGDGLCKVHCSGVSSCYSTTLDCGRRQCSATCDGSSEPDVDCNDACECNEC
jgi:hypothetical protein